MATGISNSMGQCFDWLDNFFEVCEEIYPGRADEEEHASLASGDRLACIYCGTQLSERTAVHAWEKRGGSARHICRDCWGRQVANTSQCLSLVKETVRNVEILFCVSTNMEWDVAKQRMSVEWSRRSGKREAKEMPWECFVKIKAVRKRTYQLVLKSDVPDGVVVAAVVYFLCIQYLTTRDVGLDLQMQGLAKWFVVNYLRILDMDRFASQYERLWSAKKPENMKIETGATVGKTRKDAAMSVMPYYDFWVQKIGTPTAKNTVTVDTAKPFIQKQRDRAYQGHAEQRWKWRNQKDGKGGNGASDKGEQHSS